MERHREIKKLGEEAVGCRWETAHHGATSWLFAKTIDCFFIWWIMGDKVVVFVWRKCEIPNWIKKKLSPKKSLLQKLTWNKFGDSIFRVFTMYLYFVANGCILLAWSRPRKRKLIHLLDIIILTLFRFLKHTLVFSIPHVRIMAAPFRKFKLILPRT